MGSTEINVSTYLPGETGPDHNSLSEASDVSLRRAGAARRACQLVLFHVVPGALHIDLFLRCELGADLIEGCRTGFAVFPKPGFKSLFEIRTS